MSQRIPSPAVYIVVLVILMGLTVLTVALSFVPSSAVVRIVAGQSIAVVKAALVVLFFMHALGSPAQTRAVIIVTIFWLVAILLGLTFSDYFTRGPISNLQTGTGSEPNTSKYEEGASGRGACPRL